MAHRARTTAKALGKAVLVAADDDMEPAELPKDLPEGFPYKYCWKDDRKNKLVVLLEIIKQGCKGYCWTISINRMIGAHLFIHGKVRHLLRLSHKHLYAHIEEKFPNGFLKNYKGVKLFLKEIGLVTEDDCKCTVGKEKGSDSTVACDKVKDKKTFKIAELIIVEGKDVNETDIIRLVKTRGPVSVEIEVTLDYSLKGDYMYYGAPKNSKVENHIVQITKYSTNKSGVSYFEYQNSWGPKWGVNGFGKFARRISLPAGRPSLIKSYMYPVLLDQVMDV